MSYRSMLYCFLFVFTLGGMFLRTGLFLIRSGSEFSQPKPLHFPEITECSTHLLETQGEQRGVFNYRSLGKTCLEK